MPRTDVLALALATLVTAALAAYVVLQHPAAAMPMTVALAVIATVATVVALGS